MDTALENLEGEVMANRRLMVGVVAALLVYAGTVAALPEEPDSSQGYSRSPCLDALKRGFVATDQDDHEEAYGHYQTALEIAPTSELRFQASFALGSSASALGWFDEAKHYFNQALEIKPDSATDILITLTYKNYN